MSEWTQTTLGEVARITIGRTPPRKEPRYWTDDLTYPFCTIADMTSRSVDPSREGVTQAAIDEGKAKIFPAGSLMMSFKLSIGRLGFAARGVYPNEAIARLETVVDDLDDRFLALALEGQDLAEGAGRAVKGSTLNGASLRAIGVAYPTPQDQQRIVDVMASVDAQIEALSEQARHGRAALGPLTQSMLTADDAWPLQQLGEVGVFLRGKRFTKADYTESGLGVIHYAHIHTHFGPIATDVVAHVSDDSRTRLRLASPGDVVIAATSEDLDGVGKATVWLGPADVAVHDDCQIFRHRLDPRFASFVFASPAFQAQKIQYAGGTKVTRISGADLAKITVPIPPIDTQARIGQALAEVVNQAARVEDELARLRMFRSALLASLLNQDVEIPESYDALLEAAS